MSPERRLVLASASPARLRLLTNAGFTPEVIVSGVDEDAFDAPAPADLVADLALAKARAVAARPEAADALVIGCDSLLDVDGQPHGKPVDATDARDRLRMLRGRAAVLRTGHCVIDTRTDRTAAAVGSTTVSFAMVDDAEIDAYVATGEPLAVAGAFTLDGRAAPFIASIDGDPANVIGLSLPLLRTLLLELDVRITALWS